MFDKPLIFKEDNNNPLGFAPKHHLIIISTLSGVLLIILGAFIFMKPLWEGPQVEVLETSGAGVALGEVTVEIAGAVERPGVYKLLASERVERLLVLAGGLSAEADRDWVAKNLNRAARLIDGQKVYVPREGEVKVVSNTAGSGESGVLGVNTLINLNTATVAELDSLPGIGQTRTQAIIANRPYSSTEELVSRKVIPKSVYEKIKDRITAP